MLIFSDVDEDEKDRKLSKYESMYLFAVYFGNDSDVWAHNLSVSLTKRLVKVFLFVMIGRKQLLLEIRN